MSERDFPLARDYKSELEQRYNNSYKSFYRLQYYFAHPPKVSPYAPKIGLVTNSFTKPFSSSRSSSSSGQRRRNMHLNGSDRIAASIKLVAVGDSSAEKGDLLAAFAKEAWPEEYVPTVFDNFAVSIVAEGRPYEISLWDTDGSDKYDKLRPLTYPETDVILLMFSLVDPNSFARIEKKWFSEVEYYCHGVPKLLVGTHAEKRMDPETLKELANKDLKPVSTTEGLELTAKLGLVDYVECSAHTKENLNTVFHLAVKSVIASHGGDTKKCLIS